MIYLTRLPENVPIVANDNASPEMILWWQEVVEQIETSVNEIIEAQAAAAAADAAAAAAQGTADGAQTTADGAATDAQTAQATADSALALATTAVQQDQAAAPVYSAYAGQTVSAVYVQAEAQATDDAVKAASDALVSLIAALQAANVLT